MRTQDRLGQIRVHLGQGSTELVYIDRDELIRVLYPIVEVAQRVEGVVREILLLYMSSQARSVRECEFRL